MFRLASTTILGLLIGAICGYAFGRVEKPLENPVPLDEVGQLRHELAVSDRIERMAGISALFPSIPPEALAGVLSVYRGAPLNGGDIEYIPLVAWWAGFDAAAVHPWSKLDRRTRYGRITQAVFREWGKRDPERALAALPKLRSGELRANTTIALLVGIDESGRPVDEIGALLRSVPEGPDRQGAIRALARRWLASSDLDQAVAKADLLSESFEGLSRDVTLGAARAIVVTSPERAADILITRLGPEAELPEDVLVEIGKSWVARDPGAAMSWLVTLPEGRSRDKAVRRSFSEWHRQHPTEARAWMASRLDASGDEIGRPLEPAMDVYARVISRDDPERALALAQRLSEERARERALAAILGWWLKRDPGAAEAWMEAADITADQRQAVERAAARRASHRRLGQGKASTLKRRRESFRD